MHVAKEWGVQPAKLLEWSDQEFSLAIAYLNHMAEMSRAKPGPDVVTEE